MKTLIEMKSIDVFWRDSQRLKPYKHVDIIDKIWRENPIDVKAFDKSCVIILGIEYTIRVMIAFG